MLDPRTRPGWYLGGEDAGSENDGQVLGGHLVGVAGCCHRREMAAQKGEAGDVLTQGEKTNSVKKNHHLQKRVGTVPFYKQNCGSGFTES